MDPIKATVQGTDDAESIFKINDYDPTLEEQELIKRIYSRFRDMEMIRDRQYRYFNNRTLVDVIDDSQKRFNGYIEGRDGADDWGAKTIDPLTRNKVIFVLATLAGQRVDINFFKEDGDDQVRSRIIKAMHEHSYIDENEQIQTFFEMLSATVKGTVIGYEGFKAPTQKIKSITKYDVETGEVEFTEKEIKLSSKVYSEIVPLEDFYPGDIRQRDVQKMPDVAWRSIVHIDTFRAEFAKYRTVEFVARGGDVVNDTFFKNFVMAGIDDDKVEVIRYFNKSNDEFHIVANGVLLTPRVSPLPWAHKEKGMGYPFWSTIYEPYDEYWFYGKSLAEKLRSNQDTLDALYRMLLDQTFLSIHKPVLTSAVEEIEDDMLRPGRKIPVSDVNEWKELDISSPNGSQFQMFDIVRQSIEDASASDSATGLRSQGEKTATQASIEQQGAMTLLSMFKTFMEWGAERKAKLRVETQLQFYPLPIGMEDGKVKYRKLRVDNVPLIGSPRTGSIILKFVQDRAELGPVVKLEESMRKRFEDKYGKTFDHISVIKLNEGLEEVSITPEFLEGFNVGLKVIADSSVKMSEGLKKAMALEFVDRIVTVFPDLVKRELVVRDLIEVYDKNPDEYMITSQSEQEMALYQSQKVNGTLPDQGQQGGKPNDPRTSALVEQMTGGGRPEQQLQAGAGQDRPGPSAAPSLNELQAQ